MSSKGGTRVLQVLQAYNALSISQKGKIVEIIQRPFREFCCRTSSFEPPFEHLKDKLDLVDPSLRITIELARSGEDIAQRWLARFLAEQTGMSALDIAPLTHNEVLWLFKATSGAAQLTGVSHQPVKRWSPTTTAREEFLSRFASIGFHQQRRKIFCTRQWGALCLKTSHGSVKRALTLFFEIDQFGILFPLAEPFMFSSGDISTKSESEFRRVLSRQVEEAASLFPYVVKAIDAGVEQGFAALNS